MNLSSSKSAFKRRLLPVVLSFVCIFVSLTGCLPAPGKETVNDSFDKFTLSLFQQEVSSNTINLHYTLRTPSEYGILDSPITYGSYTTDSVSVMATVENCQAALEAFPYNSLTEENQLTYDVLHEYLSLAKEGAKYLLYDEPLSPITGIQAQLPVLLAEYRFYDAKDVETYLSLIQTTPEYFASLIDFEREKSKKGLFLSDDVADSILEQCKSFVSLGNENYLLTTFEERVNALDTLSAEEKASYIKQNKNVIENFMLPAYETLINALNELRGTGGDTAGVCSLPDGKKYYEYVAKRETGSSRSIPELKKLIQKQMSYDASAISSLLKETKKKTQETAAAQGLISGDNSPDGFLKDLEEKICISFPDPPDVAADIKYVPKVMEPYLSPAFYLTPCIDSASENVIYINRAHTMENLNLYTTLAHEGYPGHLYQTTYFTQKKLAPLRSLLSFGGYTEGWATYAEMCSYYLTSLKKSDAMLAQKNGSLILGLYAFADIGIHYDGWTLEDTLSFFSGYGIKDKNTVTDIYELIVSDPGNYLKYYIGYVEILELKKQAAKKEGKQFSQEEFHRAVLDVGPAPFDIVRKYVLKE